MNSLRALLLPLLPCLALAAVPPGPEQADPKQALERGVAYLRKAQRADGTWPHHEIGATALAALTLLECGAAPDDPAVQKAARAVRQRVPTLTHTPSLALAAQLLARLAEAGDAPLVEALGVRLLAGQNALGGWSYHGPAVPAAEARRLKRLVQQRAKASAAPPAKQPAAQGEIPRQLSKEAERQMALLRKAPPALGGPGDACNTHLALLGLWAARAYGLPVDEAQRRAERRLGQSRQVDNGWGYLPWPALTTKAAGIVAPGFPAGLQQPLTMEKQKVTLGLVNLNPLIFRRISELGLAGYLAPPGVVSFWQRQYQGTSDTGVIAVLWVWAKPPLWSARDYYPPSAFSLGFTILPNNERIRIVTGGNWSGTLPPPLRPIGPLPPGQWQPLQLIVLSAAMQLEVEVARLKPDPDRQLPAGPFGFGPPAAAAPPPVPVLSEGETGRLRPSLRVSGSTPAHTAAALLDLALCQVPDPNTPDRPPTPEALRLARARALTEGLALLAKTVGEPGKAPALTGRHSGYYALWCLQSLADAYGLDRLGDKDWYAWGRAALLQSQQRDGSWQGAFAAGGADTCFALLFLKRAELARGLRQALAGQHDRYRRLAADHPLHDDPKADLPEPEKQAVKLRQLLARAAPAQQEVLLAQLRDSPAPGATAVLAGAAPRLKAPAAARARQYLAERLARLPAEGVAALLQAKEGTWRQAAAQACGLQRHRPHAPALVRLLADDEEGVVQAARQALRALSGRDYGPAAGASDPDRTSAILAWHEWSERQGKDKGQQKDKDSLAK